MAGGQNGSVDALGRRSVIGEMVTDCVEDLQSRVLPAHIEAIIDKYQDQFNSHNIREIGFTG